MPKEINRNDLVKILVSEDGIEEETYGLVAANTGRTLGMHYLYPTEMYYKSACVYRLDDDEMCPSLTQRCQRIQVVQCGQVADEDGAAAAASKCNAQTRVQDTVDAARSSVAHDYWSRRAKVIQVANR